MVDTNLYSTPTWIFCICLDPLVLDVITFPIPVLRRLLQ